MLTYRLSAAQSEVFPQQQLQLVLKTHVCVLIIVTLYWLSVPGSCNIKISAYYNSKNKNEKKLKVVGQNKVMI